MTNLSPASHRPGSCRAPSAASRSRGQRLEKQQASGWCAALKDGSSFPFGSPTWLLHVRVVVTVLCRKCTGYYHSHLNLPSLSTARKFIDSLSFLNSPLGRTHASDHGTEKITFYFQKFAISFCLFSELIFFPNFSESLEA